jgi:VanZ family protein
MEFLRYNLFGIIWGLLIAFLVLLPGQEMPPTGDLLLFDRVAHAFVFMVWVLLLIVGFKKQTTVLYLHYYAERAAIFIALLYSALLEELQFFSAGRTFEWEDLLMNTVGVLMGWILFFIIYKL